MTVVDWWGTKSAHSNVMQFMLYLLQFHFQFFFLLWFAFSESIAGYGNVKTRAEVKIEFPTSRRLMERKFSTVLPFFGSIISFISYQPLKMIVSFVSEADIRWNRNHNRRTWNRWLITAYCFKQIIRRAVSRRAVWAGNRVQKDLFIVFALNPTQHKKVKWKRRMVRGWNVYLGN